MIEIDSENPSVIRVIKGKHHVDEENLTFRATVDPDTRKPLNIEVSVPPPLMGDGRYAQSPISRIPAEDVPELIDWLRSTQGNPTHIEMVWRAAECFDVTTNENWINQEILNIIQEHGKPVSGDVIASEVENRAFRTVLEAALNGGQE